MIGLAALALVRPLFSIVGLIDALGEPAAPLLLTLAWALIVGLSRVREPLLTLVAAGLSYAVATILLSAVLSPILTGHPQGPLATPFAIVPLLVVDTMWGLIAGGLAVLDAGCATGVAPPGTSPPPTSPATAAGGGRNQPDGPVVASTANPAEPHHAAAAPAQSNPHGRP